MDLDYILRRAREISWRQKSLWPYSLIIGFVTLGPRFLLAGMRLLQYTTIDLPEPIRPALQNLHPAIGVTVLVVVTLVTYLSQQLLTTLGHTALIGQVDDTENRGVTTVQLGWQVVKHCIWKTFLIRLALVLPIAALALASSLPPIIGTLLIHNLPGSTTAPEFFALTNRAVAMVCNVTTMCLSLLIAIPLNMLQQLAARDGVLEDRSVLDAVARAWGMLKEFTGALACLWLVLLLLAMAALVTLSIPLAVAGLSIAIISLLTAMLSSIPQSVIGLFFVATIWMMVSILFSAVQAYVSAAWTLAYRELRGLGLTGS